MIKRLIDIAVSLACLILLMPLFVVVAILIKLDSSGPVFYWQRRCGRGGHEFNMFKFRSMYTNADEIKSQLKNEVNGPMFKVSNDPRITRVGRHIRSWSIDELPQLYNVFRGEMSLVGPRPLAWKEMGENESWRTTRLKVKPGCTGLWQIKGRASKKFEDWVKYDTQYVNQQSLLMDLKILFMTVGVLIRRTGAE